MQDLDTILFTSLRGMTTVTPKKKKTIVMYFEGNPIVTRSGKRAWSQINHAKCALQLHFSEEIHKYGRANYPSGSYWDIPVEQRIRLFEDTKQREEDFKQRLYSLIEFREI